MAGARRDQRSPEERSKWRKLYKSAAWKALRLAQLSREPLCAICQNKGRVTAANTADHIKPHNGDMSRFLDADNLQSLCGQCHASAKQSEERTGYSKEIGPDGWPVDDRHPFCRGNV